MPFDKVKVRPRIVSTALFLILLLLANLGMLLFLVIRDISDELTETIIQEAELEAYRILNVLEESVLTSKSRGLDKESMHSDELVEEVNALLDRKQIYLYCVVMDPNGHVMFRRESERARIADIQEASKHILRSPIPVNREVVAYIDDEPVKMLTIWVPIIIQDEHMGTLMLGVSKNLVSQQMQRITSRVMREYLNVGLIIAVIVAGTFVMVVRLMGKARQAEARIQHAHRLIYVGTLASGLGHEIRNPLNAIQINAQMLEEMITSAGREKVKIKLDLVESIRIAVGELESLVSEFLRFARPSKLKQDLLNINTLVREVVGFVEGECIRNEVNVIDHLDNELPRLKGDAQQLKQVFLNLILNANQAMPGGGTLTVNSRRLNKGRIAIDIVDTGVGIPESDQSKIFDPFYSTKKGGTGLGLPIAQRIVEEHRGQIGFQSEPGVGTTFTVELPAEDDRSGRGER